MMLDLMHGTRCKTCSVSSPVMMTTPSGGRSAAHGPWATHPCLDDCGRSRERDIPDTRNGHGEAATERQGGEGQRDRRTERCEHLSMNAGRCFPAGATRSENRDILQENGLRL